MKLYQLEFGNDWVRTSEVVRWDGPDLEHCPEPIRQYTEDVFHHQEWLWACVSEYIPATFSETGSLAGRLTPLGTFEKGSWTWEC